MQIEKHNGIINVFVLLVLDVWEHYLDYQNKRVDFINNFWRSRGML